MVLWSEFEVERFLEKIIIQNEQITINLNKLLIHGINPCR